MNSLLILEAHSRAPVRHACEEASLRIADSSGISWAARTLRQAVPDRLPGIDLAFDLCAVAAAQGVSVFLLGAAPGVAEAAAQFLQAHHPGLQIGGIASGFFDPHDEPSVLAKIRDSGARLVLVALGMPKQELWIWRHKPQLPAGLYMGVGGSFDVWGGTLKRAPLWMQRAGVEWLYRGIQEPSRWRRLAQLPRFAARVWSEKLQKI